jgi:hypothetical protein
MKRIETRGRDRKEKPEEEEGVDNEEKKCSGIPSPLSAVELRC